MKEIKIAGVIILTFLLLTSFMASSAEAVNVIRNGDFSSGLAKWVINPEIDPTWDPLSDGAVNLHPPSSFIGTIIHQNLNVTSIVSQSFSFSMNACKNADNTGTERTIAVVLTYIDALDRFHDIDLVEPLNEGISGDSQSPSLVTVNGTFPADAVKLVKIEIEKTDFGELTVDNISLSADGVIVGAVPLISGLSATEGPYGTTLTITGTNLLGLRGMVFMGGSPEGMMVQNVTNTAITVGVMEPARSGMVYVVVDGVESNIDFSFNVTSPHFTVDIMDDDVTVVKGQTAEFIVAVDFKNGFTTTGTGITFQLEDLSGNIQDPVFTPVSLTNEGGVLLKIYTSGLTAGMYPLMVNAFNDGLPFPYCSVPLDLEVVTVNDIKFYEYDSEYNRVDITGDTVTVTQQGDAGIYCEVIDSNGDIFYGVPVDLTSSVPANLAVYPGFGGGYDVYAIDSGTAILTATAPDGFSKILTVNINIPATPKVTSIYITPPLITNKWDADVVFTATGTEALGAGISGLISFETGGDAEWSNNNMTVTRTFTVDHDQTGLGTYFFSAFTGYSSYTSKRVVPFTITNDPTYSAISGGIKAVDSKLSPHATEHLTLEFYNAASGSLSFSRYFHAYHGGGEFTAGAIPSGTYKIKCVPLDESVEPQWYPNASSISDAQSVEFSVPNTTEDIYFFLRLAPLPASAWTEQNSGVAQSLYWVHFIDSSTGWAVGGNGIYAAAPDPVIIKTTDGGETWVNQTSAIMTENLYSCYFVDANNGWAVGGSARESGVCKIYRTTDGGQNWAEQTSATYRRPVAVFFIDQYNGWICGDGGKIQHTIDGGINWALQTTPTTEHICGIRFVDANNGWAGAQHGVILHTTDGGANWQTQTSTVEAALSSFDKRHFGFLDFVHTTDQGDKGWAIGIDGTIVHTDNGGANWVIQTSNTMERLWSVDFIDSQHGVVVGDNGLILMTTDGGATWTAEQSGSDKTLLHVSAVDKNTAWAVTSGGTILKYTRLRGDINNDIIVDLADAILSLKVVAGLNPTGINPGADVNGDGKIGLAEVVYILQYVAGLM